MCFRLHIGHPEIREFTRTFSEHAVTVPCGDALASVPAHVQFVFFFSFLRRRPRAARVTYDSDESSDSV
jgi:hypothetical protein